VRTALGLAFALLLAASGTASAFSLSNPNPPSCGDHGDRFTKIQLLENVPQAPHVLILGSSRARPAMPPLVASLTGGLAFNAGVHEGNASDEYVFQQLLAQRFPSARPAYLIFVDVGIAIDSVNPELADQPLARPFLGADASSKTSTCIDNHGYTAWGGLTASEPNKAQRIAKVAAGLPAVLAGIPADAKRGHHIDPARTTYFQKLLAFANAQGATPVVVLNPIYPKVLAERMKYGYPELKAANIYLAWLHARYKFIALNCQNIHKWGGLATDFANVSHIDRANMNRLVKYVVANSGNALLKH